MDSKQYKEKMYNILNDSESYELLTSSSRNNVNSDLKKLLTFIKEEGRLSRELVKQLIVQEPRIPRIYGLPKIHKSGHPLRPIADATDSVTYSIGKFLNNILKPLTTASPFTVVNSTQFCDRIRDLSVLTNERLYSFDVTQLFPSVTVHMAMTALNEALDANDQWQETTQLTKREILLLVRICLVTSECMFDGKVWAQVKGLPMGGPLSPVIAELTMQRFERLLFGELRLLNLLPKCWLRFVDDVFVIPKPTSTGGGGDVLATICNALEPNLYFTVEEEVGRMLPFLDVCVKVANDGTIVTSVFRKPMSALRLLPFQSNHHYGVKYGIVHGLVSRAVVISSNEVVLNEELSFVKQLVREGGYPVGMVEKSLNRVKAKINDTMEVKSTKVDLVKWGVTFHPAVFDILYRNFKKFGVELVASNTTKLRNCFPSQKDRVENYERKGVVYELSCNQCQAKYIGQTGQCLSTRLYRHKLGGKS